MNVPELEGCYVYMGHRFCIALRQRNWLLCCSSLEHLKPGCLSRICFFFSSLLGNTSYNFPPLWRCGLTRTMTFSFSKFLDHTQRHTTVRSTPPDEWSARRRDLYLTTHNGETSMPLVGFEITIPAGERPQTHALNRLSYILVWLNIIFSPTFPTGRSRDLTDQALLTHRSAKIFLTIRRVLSITAFCVRMCRTRRRLGSFKLLCYLFTIKSVVICTVGII